MKLCVRVLHVEIMRFVNRGRPGTKDAGTFVCKNGGNMEEKILENILKMIIFLIITLTCGRLLYAAGKVMGEGMLDSVVWLALSFSVYKNVVLLNITDKERKTRN